MGSFHRDKLLLQIKTVLFLPLFILLFDSCRKEEGCTDEAASNYESDAEADDGSCRYSLTLRFEHEVDGAELEFDGKDYQAPDGVTFRVERLRYLISDLVLYRSGGPDPFTDAHHFVRLAPGSSPTYINDPSNPTLSWKPDIEVSKGDYQGLSFNFGFASEKNRSGAYGELNQANWGWPKMLGGGYHFLQFEGEYDSSGTKEKKFNLHMGKARDTSGADTTFINNHFHVDLEESFSIDGEGAELVIRMDLQNWFEAPPASMDNGNGALWKLEERPSATMPSYGAQRTLNANGRDVFELVP